MIFPIFCGLHSKYSIPLFVRRPLSMLPQINTPLANDKDGKMMFSAVVNRFLAAIKGKIWNRRFCLQPFPTERMLANITFSPGGPPPLRQSYIRQPPPVKLCSRIVLYRCYRRYRCYRSYRCYRCYRSYRRYRRYRRYRCYKAIGAIDAIKP